jgi:RNA polymerase sigma-70 factor (ECF subfamily)
VLRREQAIFRFARSLSTDTMQAEDIQQETFLDVWRGAAGFRGDSDTSARAWLFTLARHAASRYHRLRAGEPRDTEPIEDLELLGARAGFARIDPEFIDRIADRDLVLKGFRALSPADRELLHLRDGEGFSGPEVAQMLDLTLEAMKSRLHRARLRFVAALRD